jgi:hypothetical protein
MKIVWGFKNTFVRSRVLMGNFLISKTVLTVSGAHPAFYSMGNGFFPGGKAARA